MKVFKFLFSGWFMGVLLIVFAYAIGYATFVENDHGAIAAKMVVYNTRWFELILFLMVINFSGMIFTKHLYLKSKWNILIIHFALVIIIIGAGVTRYFGSEGQMHIREGKITNIYRSSDTYLQLQFKEGEQIKAIDEKIMLAQGLEDLFSHSYQWQGKPINISVVKFYPNASQVLVKSEVGDSYLDIIVGGKDGRHPVILKEGESRLIHDFGISFGDTSRTDYIQIIQQNGELLIRFPEPMQVKSSSMEAEQEAYLIEGFNPLQKMSVHTVGETSFVIKEFIEHGKFQYQENTDNSQQGSPVIKVKVNDEELMLPGGKQASVMVNSTEVLLRIGTKMLELPFTLKLNKFEIERYPGSNSPSSFASEVTLVDRVNNVEMPYRIYMNHILNYGGYRFFQSSYDQDERGTILSVNQDYWGTLITYIGYFLLFGSLIVSFFTKTRFSRISQQLKDVHDKRKKLNAAALVLMMTVFSSQVGYAQQSNKDSHAGDFGKLFVQNIEGRIEPINTMANKVLVKISKKNTYHNLSAEQVFLGIITEQEKWQNEPLIKVEASDLQNLIGVVGDYASFADFIDENGKYKIAALVEHAYQKKPALRSTFDKALINTDERVNVFYMALNGSVLKIFPIENDPNNKWATPGEFHQLKGHGTEEGDIFENYLQRLAEARTSNNYQEANAALTIISNYQQQKGASILPSETKARLEIFYNETNIFKALFPVYLLLGSLLVAIFFLQIFKPGLEFKLISKIFLGILLIAFAAQTFGLGIRWYISGHAPWSNGYESMIYIAWATMLAGFIFMKKSAITLGVTAMLAGITLLTAHMSWLNPELTNLVPVLKSYWLTIHVATITASYGFLGLACMVAFLNLCIMIFRNKGNELRINLTLKELSLIIEMALSIGLVLLIIGNFLGGIWANESWGRYWGWDPKETWTLVTIILYSFTLHLTLIPSVRSTFTFSFMSFISFGAVLMTYFGVNYYLSGLHSYAGGDSIPVPSYVYYGLVVVFVVSALAAYNEFTYGNQTKKGEEAKITEG